MVGRTKGVVPKQLEWEERSGDASDAAEGRRDAGVHSPDVTVAHDCVVLFSLLLSVLVLVLALVLVLVITISDANGSYKRCW